MGEIPWNWFITSFNEYFGLYTFFLEKKNSGLLFYPNQLLDLSYMYDLFENLNYLWKKPPVYNWQWDNNKKTKASLTF